MATGIYERISTSEWPWIIPPRAFQRVYPVSLFWLALLIGVLLLSARLYRGPRHSKEAFNNSSKIEPIRNFELNSTKPPNFRPFKPKYHLTMGIETVDRNDLVLFDQTYSERISLRESLLRQHFDDVVGVTNESNARIRLAVQELYNYLFQTYLPVRYPSIFKTCESKNGSAAVLENLVTRQILPMTMTDSISLHLALRTIAQNVDEDFFILLPQKQEDSSEDVYVLEAYAACFPSGFQPKEKIGKKLADIHGPVPGYKEKLQKSMDRFFARLEPGRYVKRVNWGLNVDEELFSNFDSSKPAFEGTLKKLSKEDLNLEKTFLRCERQTLHRLPVSGAIVFAFHTYLYPIQDIKDEGSGENFAQAIDGLENGSVREMFTYKSGYKWADAMLNVRISSLPPDRQTAAKDCRRCIKRRIKCDRSIPRCRKCTIREFQCPGYDAIQLKWGLGITRIRKPSEKSPVSTSDDRFQDANRSASASAALIPRTGPSPGRDNEHHVSWTDRITSPSSGESTPSPTTDRSLVDSYSSAILSRNLFTHFNIKVAPRLTWVDRPDHPWRKVIAPLAQRSGCLGLSMLSVAAAHLSYTSSNALPSANPTQSINHRLRDASLHMLNQKINTELANYHSTTDHLSRDSTLIEILATTLVLCYGEMLIPHSTDWNLHLHACRVLIERYTWRNRHNKSPNAAIDFIIREVADIEVFRNIGAFSVEHPFITDTLHPQSTLLDDYFHTFTGVFREITAEERRRYTISQEAKSSSGNQSPSQSQLPLPPINMAPWRAKVELAHARASADITRLITAHGSNTQKWMESIIRAVYHASLIYAYQCLAPIPEATAEIGTSLPILLAEIEFLTAGPVHSFSHDIFVPLFIAGTECWGDRARQDAVEKRFRELLAAMGIWCNFSALRFLKGFWGRGTESGEYHRVGGWIPYAREHEGDNGPFLVF
ncbi:hypothetical protein F1880_002764 [Penicillium rolfsii]|nr:hypothetical protein F1880_002764 [Penicillium rolfsii]